jgi:uncharacterized protein
MWAIYPKDVRFDGCHLITGFHGIGATGYWAVRFLVQSTGAARVARIDSDQATPVVSTSGGRLVTPFEIYRQRSLAFFKGEVPLYRGSEVEFFRMLCDWIIGAGFDEVALIGGLDSSLRTDDSAYRIVTTSNFKMKDALASAKPLEDDHLVVGPVAMMLNTFELREFPAYAVLPYAATDRADPRAAATAVKILSQTYGFEIDVGPLLRGAEVMETELAKSRPSVGTTTDSIYT